MVTESMRGKTVLITGANSGIGLATAKGLAQLGARVVILCRDKNKADAAKQDVISASNNTDIHLIIADLAVQDKIRAAADEFRQRFDRLDVLVNNAAIIPPRRELTPEGIETQFAVNHLSYVLLTTLLLDMLKASAPSRIVNVSSNLHASGRFNPDDLQATQRYRIQGWGQYSNTKLFNHLFTFELARRLEGTNVTANVLHPGVIGTNLSRQMPRPLHAIYKWVMPKPENGAKTSVYLASSPEVAGVSGKYWVNCKVEEPAAQSLRADDARQLWDISAKMLKLDTINV